MLNIIMTIHSDDHKRSLRRAIRERIAEINLAGRQGASLIICARLTKMQDFTDASTVLVYMPMDDEVDVIPVGVRGLLDEKRVCVPVVDWDRNRMDGGEVESFEGEAFRTDERGLLVPIESQPVKPSEFDLVIVPGRAFDAAGGRLGRGGGFYDRYLSELREDAAVIGAAFECQMIDEVPSEAHDRRVDAVVTEAGIHRV